MMLCSSPVGKMKGIILMHIIYLVCQVACRNKTVEERLINDLFDGYNPSARPTYDPRKPVLLNLSINFLQMVDVDEQLQTMTTNGWINVYWNDPRLTWVPADYDGLSGVTIPPTHQPWLPRFTIMNSAAEDLYDAEFYRLFGVKLSHTGDVYWSPGGNLFTQCSLDITFYPFDEQKCDIVFANWIYTGDQVNLTYTEDAYEVLLGNYTESGEWDITGSNISRKNDKWGYPRVTFELHLRRKRLFYVSSLLIPCILLSVLAMFVFQLPPESGEKISLCTSLLLSFVVYIMVLSDSLPTTSFSIALIQIYLLMALSSTAVTVIISIIVLRTYHKTDVGPPPALLLKMCFIDRPKPNLEDSSDETTTEQNCMLTRERNSIQVTEFMEDIKVEILGEKGCKGTEQGNNSAVTLLRRIVEILETHEQEKSANIISGKNRELWIRVANFIDRVCFLLLGFSLILGTLIILVILPLSR